MSNIQHQSITITLHVQLVTSVANIFLPPPLICLLFFRTAIITTITGVLQKTTQRLMHNSFALMSHTVFIGKCSEIN